MSDVQDLTPLTAEEHASIVDGWLAKVRQCLIEEMCMPVALVTIPANPEDIGDDSLGVIFNDSHPKEDMAYILHNAGKTLMGETSITRR